MNRFLKIMIPICLIIGVVLISAIFLIQNNDSIQSNNNNEFTKTNNGTVKIEWIEDSNYTSIKINITNKSEVDFNITLFNNDKLELQLIMEVPNGTEYSMNASQWVGVFWGYESTTLKPGQSMIFINYDLSGWKFYFPERFNDNGKYHFYVIVEEQYESNKISYVI